jgi:RimJ/RimL family protein N-acetyltransferase
MADLIQLRALSIADKPLTLLWHNQPEIVDLYSGHPYPVNPECEQMWYDRILTSNIPTTVLGVERCDNNKLIGIASLQNINLINRSASLGLLIGDVESRKGGYFLEAFIKTIRFGFLQIGLNRIALEVSLKNKRLVQTYRNFGFVEEGLIRESIYKNGEFTSMAVFSILRLEFDNNPLFSAPE